MKFSNLAKICKVFIYQPILLQLISDISNGVENVENGGSLVCAGQLGYCS
jgi:hypothetical protein